MPAQPHSFAARLRALRNERGLSKTRLGEMVGVSTTCVWNWEEGNTEPRKYNLEALADALGVSTNYLELGAGKPIDKSTPLTNDTAPPVSLERAINDAKVLIAKLAQVDPKQVSISVNY
ncbi:helix-turn-helix domain-containing protein [Altererythrobacter sp. GH1-8]|uniref:helix-turn-helix domain-containing protein n=1 Tax=Altererythrobacter sp. GH1-8 TaxID=3349333 RepID=UPI00374CF749